MRKILLLIVSILILPMSAAPAGAVQCVPFARAVSGLNLSGDAWQWWNAAAGVYERGSHPRAGAVLAFPRQGMMALGHVAVVRRVISSRLVLVDHANWAPAHTSGRGKVAHSVPVLDVSPDNDWSRVRVWYRPTGNYGTHTYATLGFIAERGAAAPREIRHASFRHRDDHSAGRPSTEGLVTVANRTFHPHQRREELAAAAPSPGDGG